MSGMAQLRRGEVGIHTGFHAVLPEGACALRLLATRHRHQMEACDLRFSGGIQLTSPESDRRSEAGGYDVGGLLTLSRSLALVADRLGVHDRGPFI